MHCCKICGKTVDRYESILYCSLQGAKIITLISKVIIWDELLVIVMEVSCRNRDVGGGGEGRERRGVYFLDLAPYSFLLFPKLKF